MNYVPDRMSLTQSIDRPNKNMSNIKVRAGRLVKIERRCNLGLIKLLSNRFAN